MAEYIERQVALDALGVTKNATKYGGDHSGYDTKMLYEIHDALTGIPAADVAPVVHGEWIRSGLEGHIICNKCGYEAKHTIVERQDAIGKWISRFAQDMKTNFCPNCGAKMDGERKE